ncbi:MAG: preprotein translocase subunit SecE [Acidobacteriota bacterium]
MAKFEQHDAIDDKSQRPLTGWWHRSGEFVGEVRNEMKRVTWPTRKEVYATTVVVILTSMFFGLYLFGVDMTLNSLVQWVFQRFGAA